MPKNPVEPFHWRGFQAPAYTQTPDELFDELLAPGVLTEAELRVLLYIVRRTFGFKKQSDAISFSQLTDGIVKRDGTRLDWGAGVQRRAALRAVQSLEAKGIIFAQRQQSEARGYESTVYGLRMASDLKDSSLESQRLQGRVSTDPALESSRLLQETGQETANKRDSEATVTEGEPPPYSPYLAQVVLDHARELGAEPRGPTAVGEVLRLWAASGLSEAVFAERLHAARTAARKGQGRGGDKWTVYLAAVRGEGPAPPRLKRYFNE